LTLDDKGSLGLHSIEEKIGTKGGKIFAHIFKEKKRTSNSRRRSIS